MFKALKAETESEGASWDFLQALREWSRNFGIPMYLKIGGVEAKTDMVQASKLGINGVIAPMVESSFAVEKFALAAMKFNFTWTALTIETKTAVANIGEILEAAKLYGISGITVGRADLAASMGMSGHENSPAVMSAVSEIAKQARNLGLIVTMGGHMDSKSIEALAAHSIQIDFLETRRFVVKVDEDLHKARINLIKAIDTEIELEKQKIELAQSQVETGKDRIIELVKRRDR